MPSPTDSFVWVLHLALFLRQVAAATTDTPCPHPAVPLYASVVLSSEDRKIGTTATYTCDDGYELFGNPIRACINDAKWSGELPYCAVNVAYGKPTNQSSTVRGGEASHANDGDLTTIHENKYCTETKTEDSPWWHVDLLQMYAVRVVRVVTRGCCGHQPLHDLEIRIGNSSTVQGNRLCAWYPGTLDDGITKEFQCAYPIRGRYVFIQMVGIQGSLTLCEVMVFTTDEISSGRCGNQLEPLELTTFSRTCYEFQVQKGGSFQDAQDYCIARGGLVIHSVKNLTHNFIASELERRKDYMKTKLVWLGARRDLGPRVKTWHWVNGDLVMVYMWAEDQPNNYNNQQNCIMLDGGRKWLWNDVTCELDYLPWICQYGPSNCGSPDRKENSTILEKDFRLTQSVTYVCPIGSMVVGDIIRKCDVNGFWTGLAPSCKYVNCGPLTDIENGKVTLLEDRTTYNATAKYTCNMNYTLVGNESQVCGGDEKWNGNVPECLFDWCPDLQTPTNGSLDVTGQTAGNKAVYSCAKGNKLVGNATRMCKLGGMWTGDEPFCKFVDCGTPEEVANGVYHLIDGTTNYQNKVSYYCHDNYTLLGDGERTCLDNGMWSGRDPLCQIISCGKPDVPSGSYVDNSSYSVHSEVQYHCRPGHKMIGNMVRTCSIEGKWTGKAPVCKFIDCGRVQPILKGEVQYINGTTFLNSIVTYSCSSGYRLMGIRTRTCWEGRWSGSAPKCEEIRCVPPEVPKNSTVIYGGNDRISADSFKISSTVQYRCIPGHLVEGEPMRTCLPTGVWSGQPPNCIYVDCGLPNPIHHGHWLLPTNSTQYGSQVEYQCNANFELKGPQRRLCLENGTWSNVEPLCQEISCGKPNKEDIYTVIDGASFSVDDIVFYSCAVGYKLVGNKTRKCKADGKWSFQTPYCNLVDCGKPNAISNGQGFLANGTTTFESVIEFRCLPEFQMVGNPVRVCLPSGEWSGLEPRCTDIVPETDNVADLQRGDEESGDSNSFKVVGIAVAVSAGSLLIIIVIVAVVCMRMRRAKIVKHASSPPPTITCQENKGPATVRSSYPRVALESELSGSNLNGNGAIRNNPNGLVTFSSNPQPIYANVTVNGQHITSGELNGHQPQRQLKIGTVQSENL